MRATTAPRRQRRCEHSLRRCSAHTPSRPIVATRLVTHTQVLSDEVSLLTPATAEGFAQGILRAIENPAEGRRIGKRARQLADTKYSYDAYLDRTRQACAYLTRDAAAEVAGGVA